MSDDVDDLLKHALATLDDQAPAGYFDTLADRTLARLDGPALAEPAPDTHDDSLDEDSGLKDIRSLASETRARLGARRSSHDPVSAVDDAVASASASWKAVALPEPPAVPAASVPARRSSGSAPPAVALVRDGVAGDAPAGAPGPPGPRPGTRRAPLVAAIGVGLAAAVAVVTFVSLRDRGARAPTPEQAAVLDRLEQSRSIEQVERVAAPTRPSPPPPSSAATKPSEPVTAVAVPSERPGGGQITREADQVRREATLRGEQGAATKRSQAPIGKPVGKSIGKSVGKPVGTAPSKFKGHAPGGEPDGGEPDGSGLAEPAAPAAPAGIDAGSVAAPSAAPDAGSAPAPGGTAGGTAGEPSFDELLKEAGVDDPKPDRPRLARKQLSSDDIKRGMAAVTAQARACFDGTRGLAAVRLSVAPSGQIQKVTVSGPFAGTAVGACVVRAVRTATFPPWDGLPQSFGYSYLLSE